MTRVDFEPSGGKTFWDRVGVNTRGDGGVDLRTSAGVASFKKGYADSGNLWWKFVVASSIINNPEVTFPQAESLLHDFMPADRRKIPERDRADAHRMQVLIHGQLVEKQILPPESMEPDDSQLYFSEKIRTRPDLQALIDDGMPIEVMGQLLAVDMYSNLQDKDRLEKMREWATKSMLRVYVGTLAGKRPRPQFSPKDILDKIPSKVFTDADDVKLHLIENYLEQRYMRTLTDMINDDPEWGLQNGITMLSELADGQASEAQGKFIKRIADRFEDIATTFFDPDNRFNKTIALRNGEIKEFPSFEQRAFAYDFKNSDTRFLAAKTGVGKTGAAFLAMENSDASRVLVVAPADNAAWPTEEGKLFAEPGNIFVIRGGADIEAAAKSGKKYIVVSQSLLGRTETIDGLGGRLEGMVRDVGIDGVIFDEVDNLSNSEAIATKTARNLLGIARENYAAQHEDRSEHQAPVIAMTATPVRNKLSDLDVPMAMLYPDQYAATRGESTTGGLETFSAKCFNDPRLAHAILFGEKNMFRWEHATGIQEFSYENEVVPVSAFEHMLYTFIANNVESDMLNKLRLLENALFNPLLVKVEVRDAARDHIPPVDIDAVVARLTSVARQWKKEYTEPLTTDRLVELNMGDDVLACFFHDTFDNGIDTLAMSVPEVAAIWETKEVSSKYAKMKKILSEALQWKTDDEGRVYRNKVMIISPHQKQGRTAHVVQRQIGDGNGGTVNMYAPWELEALNDTNLTTYVRTWLEGSVDEEDILVLDGDATIRGAKDRIIDRWVTDPDAAVLIGTAGVVKNSRDFTPSGIVDEQGKEIDGITVLFLGHAWYDAQMRQSAGRLLRHGQSIPVTFHVEESEDTLDHGMGENVMLTYLLSRMVLSGIPLSQDEQEFYDSRLVGKHINLQKAEAGFLRNILSAVPGAGEDEISDFFAKVSKLRKDMTINQLVAEKFYDGGRDAYHVSGYNAEMVAFLIKTMYPQEPHVLSVGAGTMLLQRKLGIGIDNVDINPHMMEAGWQEAGQYGGKKITARASSLPGEAFRTATYHVVDNAFTLHWSKLEPNNQQAVQTSERVKILLQMNRVLADGGRLFLTLPENSFDDTTFAAFVDTLQAHFGFSIDHDFTGKSIGRTRFGTTKRLGWSIVAKKDGMPNLINLDINSLKFANEDGRWVSIAGKEKKNGKVQGREYPNPGEKMDFDHFEIINQDGHVHTITMEGPSAPSPHVPKALVREGETADIVVLRTRERDAARKHLVHKSPSGYSWLRARVHEVMERTGVRDYATAEAVVLDISAEFTRSGVRFFNIQLEYKSIVAVLESLEHKAQNGNGNGNGNGSRERRHGGRRSRRPR